VDRAAMLGRPGYAGRLGDAVSRDNLSEGRDVSAFTASPRRMEYGEAEDYETLRQRGGEGETAPPVRISGRLISLPGWEGLSKEEADGNYYGDEMRDAANVAGELRSPGGYQHRPDVARAVARRMESWGHGQPADDEHAEDFYEESQAREEHGKWTAGANKRRPREQQEEGGDDAEDARPQARPQRVQDEASHASGLGIKGLVPEPEDIGRHVRDTVNAALVLAQAAADGTLRNADAASALATARIGAAMKAARANGLDGVEGVLGDLMQEAGALAEAVRGGESGADVRDRLRMLAGEADGAVRAALGGGADDHSEEGDRLRDTAGYWHRNADHFATTPRPDYLTRDATGRTRYDQAVRESMQEERRLRRNARDEDGRGYAEGDVGLGLGEDDEDNSFTGDRVGRSDYMRGNGVGDYLRGRASRYRNEMSRGAYMKRLNRASDAEKDAKGGQDYAEEYDRSGADYLRDIAAIYQGDSPGRAEQRRQALEGTWEHLSRLQRVRHGKDGKGGGRRHLRPEEDFDEADDYERLRDVAEGRADNDQTARYRQRGAAESLRNERRGVERVSKMGRRLREDEDPPREEQAMRERRTRRDYAEGAD
jgi:hypothetical protein